MTHSLHARSSLRLDVTSAITAIAVTVALAGTATGEPRFPSHCASTETAVFSCKLRSSDKYVSLCGSKSLRAPDAYLAYRFGALDQKEFTYPAAPAGSLQKFRAAHYFRAQVDRRNVSFTNSNVTYDLFSHFEGEDSRPHHEGGVTITMAGKGKAIKTLRCGTPYFDRLELLDGVVEAYDYLNDDD